MVWEYQVFKLQSCSVVKWTSKGKIKAIIDTVYPFEDMVMGHIKMMESRLFGKLITTPQKL
ncbi:MAG TPA: zinc-binding dehydrogenase [Candidatus Bathyarchaeia archaeon]|nr:zinc-binding dehydrogenase [Candidatus Bathyarchaeia archaeon]